MGISLCSIPCSLRFATWSSTWSPKRLNLVQLLFVSLCFSSRRSTNLHHKVYRFQTPAFGQRSCDHQRCNETRIIPYPKSSHSCTQVELQSIRFERCMKTKTPYLSIVYSIVADSASYTQGMWGSTADSRQSTKNGALTASDQMSPHAPKSLTGNEI